MRIQLRYFAVFRERIGREQEIVEVPEGASVKTAVDLVAQRHSTVAALRGRFRVAVNSEFVTEEHSLQEGDEIVLIPPVAGGGPHARIVKSEPSLDRVMRAISHAKRGGIVTFTGVVRSESQGKPVERLEYEAYGEMAERVLREICSQIAVEIPGTEVAVEHRTGSLVVGDIAVVIAAGAPHRDQAFRAARAAIDRLKERTPIWKKEIGPGGAEWVGLGP